MTEAERDRIDQLTEWVGDWQRTLNELTTRMSRLAEGVPIVSEATWDRLFQARENLQNAALAVSRELDEAAREAGVPGV